MAIPALKEEATWDEGSPRRLRRGIIDKLIAYMIFPSGGL